jgi:hypothetical protein
MDHKHSEKEDGLHKIQPAGPEFYELFTLAWPPETGPNVA